MDMNRLCVALCWSASLFAAHLPEYERARELYQRTEYRQSLNLLAPIPNKDAETLLLIGKNEFMLGEYKRATDALEKALALGDPSAELYLWLGRAYGRRAETANPFTAPGYASRARRMFEKAAEMDISNRQAVGDLFDYYMGAPGILGGGLNKAEDLAHRMEAVDPAEGQYLLAQIEDKRKRYDMAEQHLRRALELAPRQVNRILDLARYLSKHGRSQESEALFQQAEAIAPANPRVLYYRAEAYIESQRNLDDARRLLEQYLSLPLTPDYPPRESAKMLLDKIHG